jgi:hypothetical protein
MGRLDVFFAKIEFLGGVCLHVVGVHAAGGGVTDLFHFGTNGFPENEAVEEEIGSRTSLMEIDVAATAMIGGEVEDHLSAFHGFAGDARFAEVGVDESDLAGLYVAFDIFEATAGQVVDNMNFGAARHERIDEVRADKGSTARNEYLLMIPDDGLQGLRFVWRFL